MIQIDKDSKEKRNKKYNDWARTRPAYIFLAIPIVLGVTMGINDYMATKLWGKALIYLTSISTISAALFFLLKFTLRDISKLYPGKILFCDRLKPTTKLLYNNDSTYTEEQKAEIRKKIKSKKNIDLQKYKLKTYRNKKYVKRVDEAVVWLLDVTRFDDILFEYNCMYGFWRNLTGALLIDALFVWGLTAVNKWLYTLPFGNALEWLGGIMILLIILTTIITYNNGRIFAKKVYDVFMNLDEDKNNY
ncbi:hypothetical protein [Tannerella forsythia]|uniref:hypothetical protein n=1 Tax=Tannerella forsythia TaxID=28112 RepID=UPI0028DCC8DB|nr:hypothetical protein [Tannerella forsythia]